MLHRSITYLLAVGAVSALLILAPLASHAIPVAGEYVFTSGLTGTFTSDGTQLTAWAIQDLHEPTLIWSDTAPTQGVLDNSYQQFSTGLSFYNQPYPISFQHFALALLWGPSFNPDWYSSSWVTGGITGIIPSNIQGPMTFEAVSSASVPEPSALMLLGLGLGMLALVDYMRRQRPYAGLQVG